MVGLRLTLAGAILCGGWQTATAATLHVAAGGKIQDAIAAAHPGDIVLVEPGTYAESLRTVRAGAENAPITVKASGARGTVTVRSSGRVLTVNHPYFTIDGLVFDGNYGQDDIVRVATEADHFVLRNSEVLRTSKDGIDMGAPSDVLIEDSLIHHTLNAAGGRTDAHGVVAGAVHRLTIRRTEIHTFSGDAVQLDPSRAAPGWDDILIDTCKLWLAPLPATENGFAAGTVPGENAVDTKSNDAMPRAHITIRNTNTWGFRSGLITNMAAFNLKENIDALVDGVTVWDSEIGFRVRGPSERRGQGAWVRIQNAVIYDTTTAFRYEDDVQNLKVWNVTVGAGVEKAMLARNAAHGSVDVRNLLVLGTALPAEASGRSNLAVRASAFIDAAKHDYTPSAGSPAIDAGETIADVARDRAGAMRPRGRGYDVGAFER